MQQPPARPRTHGLDITRLVLINCLVVYHNIRIFQGPKNSNQIVIWPPSSWYLGAGSPEWEQLYATWDVLGKVQRSLLQEGLNLFFLLAGFAAYLSLMGRKNILSFVVERFNKLVLAFAFGVFFLAVPSNYFILLCKKKPDTPSFFSFLTWGKAYEPGHLMFLPYLFLLTVAFMPQFLYNMRIFKRKAPDGDSDSCVDVEYSPVDQRPYPQSLQPLADTLPFPQLSVHVKAYLLAAFFALYTLVLTGYALSYSSVWLLVGITLCMCVWILGQPARFEERLSAVSLTLLCTTFIVPLFVFYVNSTGDPFFLHPLGTATFFLTFLVLPLLPISVEACGVSINSPLVAIGLMIAAQLQCLVYPDRLLRDGHTYHDISPAVWLTGEWLVSERTLYSWGYMVIGHSSMFAAGFLKICYDDVLPALPLGTTFNWLLCTFFILVVGPQMTSNDPEGWEFLNPGYVAYDYTRYKRLMYACGAWFWSWFAVLLAHAGQNEFNKRPFLAWMSDCCFGIFFCHVFWETVVAYTLIDDSLGGQWNWYVKMAVFQVATFVCSYAWCWVVMHIPVVRMLCGMKPPKMRDGETYETKLFKRIGAAIRAYRAKPSRLR